MKVEKVLINTLPPQTQNLSHCRSPLWQSMSLHTLSSHKAHNLRQSSLKVRFILWVLINVWWCDSTVVASLQNIFTALSAVELKILNCGVGEDSWESLGLQGTARNGNPLQCSCLENPRDGGAWWAAIYGVIQSRTRLKWLSSNIIIIVS